MLDRLIVVTYSSALLITWAWIWYTIGEYDVNMRLGKILRTKRSK